MRVIMGLTEARRALRAPAFGAAALLVPLGLAAAQQARTQNGPPEQYIVSADGAGPDFDTRTMRRGFNLFAQGDGAFSGMRATGNWGSSINNYGPCDGTFENCQNSRNYVAAQDGWYAPFFEIQYYLGAPPSQFLKIRSVAPSVANAAGGGWMADFTKRVVGSNTVFGPRDGTLGKMFSGVTSTEDGSCRDHRFYQNGWYSGGIPLLPTSDCPETWGSDGWQGAHPIDLQGWTDYAAAVGPDFAFDFWRVPEAFQRTDKMFLGTRHHAYGETEDHASDYLAQYGSVIPGGTGNPAYQGYPVGLVMHFDAFNFGVPTVNGAAFVQMTIVNESEKVWGTGIDYDSLYLGMGIGTLLGSQNASRYALPDRGMTVYHNSNVQGAGGPCDDAYRNAEGRSCTGNTSSVRGYGAGAIGIIYFKTPLGDLRNKLFTRTPTGAPCVAPDDPFCNPSHPLAGDTITFNRQSYGDYGGAYQWTWGAGARASFGFISADENNTLAGRDAGAATDRQLFTTFRSEDWTTNKVHYNKYVPPGNWDYNHDGVLDTLAVDTCGRLGCVPVDSDTMPGGWRNSRGNIGGLMGFGPFSLAAGDTASWVYAIVGDGDSVSFWSQVNATLDLYLNFYLAPEAPPLAAIVSTETTPGTDQFGTIDPEVRLFFSDAPEAWVDPYLTKLADDIESGAQYPALLAANPWLADSIRARSLDNLDRIEIYKSCDGGNSWTADSDCDGDPAVNVNGSSDQFGWRAYATIGVDANNGNIPNSFLDGDVDGGRTYTYALVGWSRGAQFLVVDAAGEPQMFQFAPTISNPLSRSTSDANVAAIYIPASKPAGYRAAAVSFTSMPTATVPFELELNDAVAAASYRAIFGNEILVERDSNTATQALVSSSVTIRRRETVYVSGTGVDSVIRADTYTYAKPQTFLVEGAGTDGAPTAIATDMVRIATTYDGLGFLLVETGSGEPVFGSITLEADAATPAGLLGRDDYRGFTVNADNSVAGDYDTESQYRGEQSRAELNLLPSDTIVPRDIVDGFMVQWREASSTSEPDAGGQYVVHWTDDPFGVGRGFVLNLTNPSATEAEVQASLAGRATGTTGLTDQATADLLSVAQTDLVAVEVPFTVENTTFGRPVMVAMEARASNRILLGQGNDTISVEVQDNLWVPGDVLYFIEDIVEDSTIGGNLVLTGGQPEQRTRRAVTFSEAILGCNQIRESCNPVVFNTAGGSGYNPMRSGDQLRFAYYEGFSPITEYVFDVAAALSGAQITAVTDSALDLIRVVPNPYVVYSAYQTSAAEGQLLFTNLPSRGTLRIYTLAAQFVQQIDWEAADLQGDGDLFWDMRTREGIDIASGLYIWVVTAPSNPNDPGSAPLVARGKFVVIRGDSQ